MCFEFLLESGCILLFLGHLSCRHKPSTDTSKQININTVFKNLNLKRG